MRWVAQGMDLNGIGGADSWHHVTDGPAIASEGVQRPGQHHEPVGLGDPWRR